MPCRLKKKPSWRSFCSSATESLPSPRETLIMCPPFIPWTATHFTVFFYLHIFTGSVGRRILVVVPVDTLHRTSIISSSTVLLLNLFVNLSLAPLSLFLIYGPDRGVWPDCWVSEEFLRAPIPRKGRVVPPPPPRNSVTKLWYTTSSLDIYTRDVYAPPIMR